MSREQLSPLKKAAVIAGASLAAIGIGKAMDRLDGLNHSTAADTLEFAGQIGLIAAGIKGYRIMGGKYVTKMYENEERERQSLIAQLPTLREGLSPHVIRRKLMVKGYESDNGYIYSDLYMTMGAAEYGYADDSKMAYLCLHDDIDRTITKLADYYTNDTNDRVSYQAARLSWFLDEALPIASDCTKTPQTEDEGKYWFDYIQHQAFARAELLMPWEAA